MPTRWEAGKKSKLEAEPEAKVLEVQKKSRVDVIGDRINRNWHSAVNEGWNSLKEDLKDIEPSEDADVYLYVTVDRETQVVSIDDVSTPDFYQGASASRYWLAAIPVDSDTTKQDLLETDLSEESHFYDDLDIVGESTAQEGSSAEDLEIEEINWRMGYVSVKDKRTGKVYFNQEAANVPLKEEGGTPDLEYIDKHGEEAFLDMLWSSGFFD